MIESKVRVSLEAMVATYGQVEKLASEELLSALIAAFSADKPFLEKVDLLDEAFDNFPRFEELREYAFDLLMINFFSEDVQKLEEDYLESEEWEAIEESTIDRGSELLNILLYLQECEDAEVEPTLDDFLKEFLLVEEDEFQDEYRIYEPLLSNQILIDSDAAEIAKVASSISEEEEIADLFYGIMGFFADSEGSESFVDEFVAAAPNLALDLSLYQSLTHFNKN